MDPAVHPPPDLMIEVDVTSSSLIRFPIFAAFGVPEVWRYDGTRVAIFHLEGGQCAEVESSSALPPLTAPPGPGVGTSTSLKTGFPHPPTPRLRR